MTAALVCAVFGRPPYRYGMAFVRAEFEMTDEALEPFVVPMLEAADRAKKDGETIWAVEIFNGEIHILKKNPHNWLRRIRPVGEDLWKCWYCGEEGPMDTMHGPDQKVSCWYDYPPCKDCGQTPLCSLACLGIRKTLQGLRPEES